MRLRARVLFQCGSAGSQASYGMRSPAYQFCRTLSQSAGFCVLVLLSACAGGQGPSTSPSLLDKLLAVSQDEDEPTKTAAAVEPKGCGSPAQCKLALKKMMDSPKRGWVGQHQEPSHYVDGTRLFAYRALRGKLSCRELSLAITEVRGAAKSLAGEVSGVSREQVSRTRALSQQVEGELARERGERCKA